MKANQPRWPPSAPSRAALAEATLRWHADLRRLTPNALVTPVLVAINVIVFLAMAAAGARPFDPSVDTLIAWGANFGPITFSGGEQWRLLTCAFLHSGVGHLAFNMFCLVGVGLLTERMFGSVGFLLTYLISAVVGSLVSVTWAPNLVSVGASGAVFGVFGAFFAACSRSDGTIPKPALVASRANMGKLLAINLAFGVFVPNIDLAAHVGGLVCGLVCGLLLGHVTIEGVFEGREVSLHVLAYAPEGEEPAGSSTPTRDAEYAMRLPTGIIRWISEIVARNELL